MKFSGKIYLKIIAKDNNRHTACNKPIAAFVYDYATSRSTYLNFEHPDLPPDCTFEQFKNNIESAKCEVYVNNKKTYKYWLNCKLLDVSIFEFVKNNEVIEEPTNLCKNYYSIEFRNINSYNCIIPYAVHQKVFDEEVNKVLNAVSEDSSTYCFKFFNDIVTDTLFQVEKNGLKVDKPVFDKYFDSKTYDNIIYTDYHIYNPTGRPSNCYDNINFVALKKDDGSRNSFVSRYEDGYLLMVDFTGFHPYIVANLIDYKVPAQETIYEHLAKYYYNVEVVSADLLAKSKKLTMVNLYGQISEQYINIPYFTKTEELKEKYWKRFIDKGYVKTPLYKRKITNKHVLDANKNKLFAYIIQATETEYGIDRLNNCLKFVSNKQILPVLYNYDAILFDIAGNSEQADIKDLIEIIKNKKFKVKVYKGKNYNDMKLV